MEHTITEEITGVDIVQAQIRIAGGASLADIGLGSQVNPLHVRVLGEKLFSAFLAPLVIFHSFPFLTTSFQFHPFPCSSL